MKFEIQLKDPDGVFDSVREAADKMVPDGVDEEEAEAFKDVWKERFDRLVERWFRYGEYLTVEIDTEDETCVVKEAR